MSMGPTGNVWGHAVTGYEVILLALAFYPLTHVLTLHGQCLVRCWGALVHRLTPGNAYVLFMTSNWEKSPLTFINQFST
jgi:hypothetical protein